MTTVNANELEPLEPERARQMYLTEREDELSDSTIRTYRHYIGKWVEWCEENEIDNLNDVTPRTVHEYRVWLKDRVERTTVRQALTSVRAFLRWCETMNAVPSDTADKVQVPKHQDADARDTMLEADAAESILSHLERFDYASRDHVVMTLLWRTGLRTGSLRAIDVEDLDLEEKALKLVHRPDEETPLKNAVAAERWVALSDETCRIIRDYIHSKRKGVTDDYGRDPLLTTAHGRLSRKALQQAVYRLTRPCIYGDGCPHDRDPHDCDAANGRDAASKCPSSVSPHPIRRGSITHHLRNDVPKTVVSDRCDVSTDVLDAHYNQMTEKEKAEKRRGYLSNI